MVLGMAALGGCSVLPQRPYLEKRDWPLEAMRSAVVVPRAGAPVLLVRTLRAAPGLEARGLQSLQPDGSVRVDPYEAWSVADQLRRWLAASGLFGAVLAPGSRAHADLVLEGELLTLIADPVHGVSRAALGVVLLDVRPAAARLRLQAEIRSEAPLTAMTGPGVAASGCAALAALLGLVEQRVAAAL
jgi:cholesterol transport system auxiliary component